MVEKTVPIGQVSVPTWSWRRRDPMVVGKLASSYRRHGQLRRVVVRSVGPDVYESLDGGLVLAGLTLAGAQDVNVLDLGELSDDKAVEVALSAEIRGETDYSLLAMAVGRLVAGGHSAQSLAGASPFTAERLDYFAHLSFPFDWSQFENKDENQTEINFGDD